MTPIERAIEAARDAGRKAMQDEADKFTEPACSYISREYHHRADAEARAKGLPLPSVEDGHSQEVADKSFAILSNAAIDAFLSALSEQGMVVVPKEATEEMAEAGWWEISLRHPDQSGMSRGVEREAWSAMIAASQGNG